MLLQLSFNVNTMVADALQVANGLPKIAKSVRLGKEREIGFNFQGSIDVFLFVSKKRQIHTQTPIKHFEGKEWGGFSNHIFSDCLWHFPVFFSERKKLKPQSKKF